MHVLDKRQKWSSLYFNQILVNSKTCFSSKIYLMYIFYNQSHPLNMLSYLEICQKYNSQFKKYNTSNNSNSRWVAIDFDF